MNIFLRYTSVCVQPITLEALDDCDAHSDPSVIHICTFLETKILHERSNHTSTVYNGSLTGPNQYCSRARIEGSSSLDRYFLGGMHAPQRLRHS